MVGLRQIDEFKVKREGASQQNRLLDWERMHQCERDGGLMRGLFAMPRGFGVAAANRALAQGFDLGKEFVACLLAQYLSEQRAQRSHIAA
jgi:hypothetical protein